MWGLEYESVLNGYWKNSQSKFSSMLDSFWAFFVFMLRKALQIHFLSPAIGHQISLGRRRGSNSYCFSALPPDGLGRSKAALNIVWQVGHGGIGRFLKCRTSVRLGTRKDFSPNKKKTKQKLFWMNVLTPIVKKNMYLPPAVQIFQKHLGLSAYGCMLNKVLEVVVALQAQWNWEVPCWRSGNTLMNSNH